MATRKLVVAERLTVGAERGQWLSRDWQGRPLTVRRTRLEAIRSGLKLALGDAAAACVDLSLFDVRVP